jgi:hypothetical protein
LKGGCIVFADMSGSGCNPIGSITHGSSNHIDNPCDPGGLLCFGRVFRRADTYTTASRCIGQRVWLMRPPAQPPHPRKATFTHLDCSINGYGIGSGRVLPSAIPIAQRPSYLQLRDHSLPSSYLFHLQCRLPDMSARLTATIACYRLRNPRSCGVRALSSPLAALSPCISGDRGGHMVQETSSVCRRSTPGRRIFLHSTSEQQPPVNWPTKPHGMTGIAPQFLWQTGPAARAVKSQSVLDGHSFIASLTSETPTPPAGTRPTPVWRRTAQ